jgi:DinB superfamily
VSHGPTIAVMASARDDLIALFEHVWQRLHDRMAGLTDDEWAWRPTDDDRVGLRWRLDHIAEFLSAERDGPWLGLPATPAPATPADSAAQALAALERGYAHWRGLLDRTTEESLAEPIGAPGGRWGDSTRYSFALHIVDELIHHGAEAALFRDLYAGRR